jgi:phosphoglycerate dehydrogenase-like enzyme
MSGAKVVFLTGLQKKVVDAIVSYNPETWTTQVVDGKSPEAEQLKAVKDADFVMVFRAKLTDNLARAASRARLVQLLSAGYDSMNLKLLNELKIPCANNGGANSRAVADHAVLGMLALYRNLSAADKAMREGKWSAAIDGTNTFEMAGKLVGIMGIGNIGQKVARRVQAFESKVQYYDPYLTAENLERVKALGAKPVSLEELFRSSDIFTSHAPLTRETHHVVNRERLAMMKPTAILVNASRGPIVDEAALIEALQQKRIAAAAIDVFEDEPTAPDNPLFRLSNVIVTPHSAGTTWDTWFRRADFAYQNMRRVWDGQAPQAVATDYDG